VNIGPALAEARSQAGMTVADVSERTRIRKTIISDIERDDYAACGGDFYARGHIRAIAKAVGTDPVPLIEEYDGNVAARDNPPAMIDAEQKLRPAGPDPETWWREAVAADQQALHRDPAGAPSGPPPQPGARPGSDTLPQAVVIMPGVAQEATGEVTRPVPPVTGPPGSPPEDAGRVTQPQAAAIPAAVPDEEAGPDARPHVATTVPRPAGRAVAPPRENGRTGPRTLVIRPDKEPGAWLPSAMRPDPQAAPVPPAAADYRTAAEREEAEAREAEAREAAALEAAAREAEAREAAAREAEAREAAARVVAAREAAAREVAAREAAARKAAAREAAAARRAAAREAAAARAAAAAAAFRGATAQVRQASAGALGRAGTRMPPREDVRRVAQAGGRALGAAGTRMRQAAPESVRETAGQARRAVADALGRMLRLRTTGRRLSWIVGGLAILLALLILLIYAVASGGSSPAAKTGHAAAARHGAAAGPAGRARVRVRNRRPPGSPPPAAPVPLTPASVTAFGPAGPHDGDNPQLAPKVVTGGLGGGWNTNWYTTASFGGLQSGTGLLLDMGSAVTVTTATVELGPTPGASLQLRAGNTPALSGLQIVATTAGAAQTAVLRPSKPVRARYLLVWFTKLPRDSRGTYQAAIRRISLTGVR
jgi:transcriptional regulator with XRE-family HTH domain